MWVLKCKPSSIVVLAPFHGKRRGLAGQIWHLLRRSTVHAIKSTKQIPLFLAY